MKFVRNICYDYESINYNLQYIFSVLIRHVQRIWILMMLFIGLEYKRSIFPITQTLTIQDQSALLYICRSTVAILASYNICIVQTSAFNHEFSESN